MMTRLASLLPKLALFVVSALLSGVIASVVVNATSNNAPVSTVGNAPAYLLAGADTPSGNNAPAAFNEQPAGSAAPLPTLTPTQLQAASKALIGAKPAKWVNPTGFPRITPITQFDGGPLQNFNCTMASGAMLARLASGIVTDGSTLRSLQAKQSGGTSLNDLAAALQTGYNVQYHYGLIRLDSLKALLKAGYGAVIQGVYGQVPTALRLQQDFTGGHAIYIDGYFPGDSTRGVPEAYYVIDPLGHPWSHYEGDWWPASVVDAFMTAFSGAADRALAMWAYPPGGTPPAVVNPDVLPIPSDPPATAAPSGSPAASPVESPSGSGAESPSTSASASAPTGSGGTVPFGHLIFAGDEAVLLQLIDPVQSPSTGGFHIVPILDLCLRAPTPSGCPTGLPATVTLTVPPPSIPPGGPGITVLFVDSPTANIAIVGYTVTPATTSDVRFWQVGSSPSSVLSASAITTAQLDGQTVTLAQLDVNAASEYQFQVVAGSGGSAGASSVGDFHTGAGVAQFDVTVGSAPSPSLGFGSGFSPYLHVPQGGFVPPLVSTASGGSGCEQAGTFNGVSFCLQPVSAAVLASCPKATVTYAVSGLDGPGVVVRAYPQGGSGGVGGVVEATGPATGGTIDVGCLTSGLTYTIALYAQGDGSGVLAQRTVAVP